MSLYEAMFVLDNDAVRAGWADAKGIATGILEKHGATLRTARRWDERKLAYPIRGKNRATYLLSFFEAPGDAITMINRDLELDERVLRYLILAAEELPEGEEELSKAELAGDFLVPEPPPDVEQKPEPEPEPEAAEKPAEEKAEEKADEKKADEAEPAEAKADEPEPAEAKEDGEKAPASEAPAESATAVASEAPKES